MSQWQLGCHLVKLPQRQQEYDNGKRGDDDETREKDKQLRWNEKANR
jgi:hypothetical protein